MQNGSTNGALHFAGPPSIQVNPMQAAQFALTFLARTDMKPHERDMFAVAEGMLKAIVSGQVVLSSPAPSLAADASEGPAHAPPS
jgi:hypothetical protein